MRRYTGIDDGIAKGARPGLMVLVDYITTATKGVMWNNGTFANRRMRGKQSMSVHATGRACDMSFRQVKGKGVNGRPHAINVIKWLVRHADEFGIEMIIDYFPQPHGRGWRCDRGKWMRYSKPTVSGAPGGDWIHYEISPRMADDKEAMQAAITAHPLPPLESVAPPGRS